EPGGGGYVAQRMLAAKDEQNAMGATLFYNIAHYALRPWPWILIALASLIVYPDTEALRVAYPNFTGKIDDDLAYPAMLNFLPSGLLGLVVASLLGAFMSTISTHLNWGSSYIVHDWYLRFIRPDAEEKDLVRVGRISTVLLMAAAALIALVLENALQAFDIIVLVGAGTGLLFILRWFWWRISAYSEIAALILSFLVAVYLEFIHPELGFEAIQGHRKLLIGVGLTTVGWILVTLLTPPTEEGQLLRFFQQIRPAETGWRWVADRARAEGLIGEQTESLGRLPLEILGMLLGCFAVYGALFCTGYYLYGAYTSAGFALALTLLCSGGIFWIWGKINQR
ncbi:MAG: Na+:solute symporter, partial [Bacteroidota bacterium]